MGSPPFNNPSPEGNILHGFLDELTMIGPHTLREVDIFGSFDFSGWWDRKAIGNGKGHQR